jgi:protein SCO1
MMSKKRIITFVLFLIILSVGIGIAYKINLDSQTLPIYNPANLNPQLVDESVQKVYKNHQVGSFSLINHLGDTITEKDFEGKIYVVDFFFTTCQTICPKMTTQMKRVQDAYLEDEEVKLLSHTVTPEIDSVAALREYAKQVGVNATRWLLATGDPKEIYTLARKSYFALVTAPDESDDEFVHTENFVLIDKDKRLRGFYDGTSTKDVDRLINDIKILKKEYKK